MVRENVLRLLRLPILLVAAVLLAAPAAHADALSDYRDGYTSYRDATMEAFHELMEGNREEAKLPLDNAIARWIALDAIAASDAFVASVGTKKRRAFTKLRGPVLLQLEKARALLDQPGRPVADALKRARGANRRTGRVGRLLDTLHAPGLSLVERKADSTGFHAPGKSVELRLLARDGEGDRCTGTALVQVSNLFGAATVDGASMVVDDDGFVSMLMGEEMGIARVEGSLCGASDTAFVFNKGPKTDACGNGEIDGSEECDAGSENSDGTPDACRLNCRLPRCGDGVLDTGEACEPSVAAAGCVGEEQCVPAALAGGCSCVPACAVSPVPASFSLMVGSASGTCGCTLGSAEAGACGAPGSNISDLACGDLLIGGGLSAVPPGRIPDGIRLTMAVAVCGGTDLILGPSAATGAKDCSRGLDVTGAPRCFFGPPLPIPNLLPPVSTCVVNAISRDVTGTIDTLAGEQALHLGLSSQVFLTGTTYDDETTVDLETCPRCVDAQGAAAASGTCNLGQNAGLACESTNSTGLTMDCLPDETLFVGALGIELDPLTTGTTALSAADGRFCNFGLCVGGTEDRQPCNNAGDCPLGSCQPRCQGGSAAGQPCDANEDCQQDGAGGVCGQLTQGAFSAAPARRVVQSGTPAPPPFGVGDVKDAVLGGVFCIPRTGTPVIDSVSDLPGPGALSLDVSVSLD